MASKIVYYDKKRAQYWTKIAGARIYADDSVVIYKKLTALGFQAKNDKSVSIEKGSWK